MPKVRIGFFSFTEVTDPAEHKSYNEWHQLDHMPEQYPLPGVVYGQRWVSTPACRRARAVDSAPLSSVHYMTLYLMGEPVDATLEEFRALGERLRAAGRFHQHRRSRLSGPFALIGMWAAPRVLISADAVPYRPNRGVYVVVRDGVAAASDTDGSGDGSGNGSHAGDGDGAGESDRHDEDTLLAKALVGAGGVAGVWSFATSGRFDRHGWHPGDKAITVCYLDGEPLDTAPELGALVRATGDHDDRRALFAGPLETITPRCWDWFDDDG